MKDERAFGPTTSIHTQFWRVTLALPFLLWPYGFLSSLIMGCRPTQASLQAIAYALSGLAGWIAYLLVKRPAEWSFRSLLPAAYAAMGGIPLLGPTRTPWPFAEMLAHGLIRSVVVMSLIGLVFRLLRFGGRSAPFRVAPPASDAETASPVGTDRF